MTTASIETRRLLRNTLLEKCVPPRCLPLAYHNHSHVDAMQDNLHIHFRNSLRDNQFLQLLLAVRFHDCVYVPGAAKEFTPTSVNEKLSAGVFLWTYKNVFYPWERDILDVDYEKVAQMIEATWFENHVSKTYVPPDGDTAILMDLDLSGLGTLDYAEFSSRQKAIASEVIDPKDSVTQEHEKLQAPFLDKFLEKPFIYHTEVGRNAWETTARANIQAYKTNLGLT